MTKQVMKVDKIIRVENRFEIIRFQLIVYKFTHNLCLSDNEINALSLLLDKGYSKNILKEIVSIGYFKTEQSVRNCISKAVELGIILTKKDNYEINSTTSICICDYTLLDIKAHNINDTKEQEIPSHRDSSKN